MDEGQLCGKCSKPKAKAAKDGVAVCQCGQPTKYDRKFCDEIIAFFDIPPYSTIDVTVKLKNGTEVTKTQIVPADLPTLAGFARKILVHRDTVHEWSKEYPEFSDAIKRAKTIQEDIWTTNGMKGYYDTTFAIFFGKNNLGYVDKTEQKVTVEKDGAAVLAASLLGNLHEGDSGEEKSGKAEESA